MNIAPHRIFLPAIVAVLTTCLSLTAIAGTINYTGPMPGPDGMTGWLGDDVWFGGVSESNTVGPNGDAASLFGAPASVSGNTIDFNPTNFVAQSDNGEGAVTVDSQLSFMVVAQQGTVINDLLFTEAGDTTLNGNPNATFAVATVSNSIFIDVVAIDGVTLTQPVNLTATMTFTPSDGDFVLSVDGDPVSFTYNDIWTGQADIDISQELIDLGIDFENGATKLNVTLDNTLTANSVDGSSAFIKKKDFDGLVVTSNVPEPTAALLLVLACLPFATTSRRS